MRCKLLPLILGALSLGSLTLSAAVVIVPVATDGYIRATGSLFSGDTVLVGKTSGITDYINGLFAFDLAALVPENSVVESISFSLFATAPDNTSSSGTFSLYHTLQDFTSSATWTQYAAPDGGDNHLWATPGAVGGSDRGALLSTVVINPNVPRETRYTFESSTAFVNAANNALENGDPLLLWVGIEGGTSSRSVFRAVSSEGSLSLRPVLTITYTTIPEPGTVAMLAVAGGVAVGMGRRKK